MTIKQKINQLRKALNCFYTKNCGGKSKFRDLYDAEVCYLYGKGCKPYYNFELVIGQDFKNNISESINAIGLVETMIQLNHAIKNYFFSPALTSITDLQYNNGTITATVAGVQGSSITIPITFSSIMFPDFVGEIGDMPGYLGDTITLRKDIKYRVDSFPQTTTVVGGTLIN